MKLTFKDVRGSEDRNGIPLVATAEVPGHTITREVKSPQIRNGWHYTFSCSCGWSGASKVQRERRTNAAAESHVRPV